MFFFYDYLIWNLIFGICCVFYVLIIWLSIGRNFIFLDLLLVFLVFFF